LACHIAVPHLPHLANPLSSSFGACAQNEPQRPIACLICVSFLPSRSVSQRKQNSVAHRGLQHRLNGEADSKATVAQFGHLPENVTEAAVGGGSMALTSCSCNRGS
jgi:hypothetical protein